MRLLNASISTYAKWIDEPAEIPTEFSIDEVIASGEFGFGNGKQIKLEAVFHHGVGDHLFVTPISTDQTLADLDDGSLKFTATVADTQQLVWWLLGFEDGVEVIKSLALRRNISDTIAKMAQRYR